MADKSGVLMGRYELGRLLGQGTFAKVYFARSVITGQSVAIKMFDKERVVRVNMNEQIKREVSVLRMVRHPNIVHLYEVMATKTKIYFVMEYAKGGELFDKLVKGKLKEDVARKYFQQLIGAVEFCHSRGVYHRDLKPENLLLDENDNLKVSDFGLSALAASKRWDGLLHTRCGTPAYVAPEVIQKGGNGYDGAKADIWSCGVILFVLLAGYLPFHDSNVMALYNKIGKAEYRCPASFPKDAKRLLQKILEPDPNNRITIAKIKESSWYRNVKALKSAASSSSKNINPPPVPPSVDSDSNVAGPSRNGSSKDNAPPPVDSKSNVAGPSRNGSIKDIAPPPVDSKSNIAGPSGSSSSNNGTIETAPKQQQEQVQVQPIELNAFDIISLSCGFDLSGLFEDCGPRKETRFTSRESASVIISRLIETAKCLRLKVSRMDKGLLNFEASKEGKKGHVSIDAEIFEVAPSLFMVEMRKCRGDTIEYQRMLKEDLRPALRDIVWAWQGEQQGKSQQAPLVLEQHEQQQPLSPPPAPSTPPQKDKQS